MPLMANQFSIKVHSYSCCLLLFLLSTVVVIDRSAAATTTTNDYRSNNSSSQGIQTDATTALLPVMMSSQPTLTQSLSSPSVTSSSHHPIRLTNASTSIVEAYPTNDVTTPHSLYPPQISDPTSLLKSLKSETLLPKQLENDINSSDYEPRNKPVGMSSSASGNATEHEIGDGKNDSSNGTGVFFAVSNSSDDALDKDSSDKRFPIKRHLTDSNIPSQETSDNRQLSYVEQTDLYANATSNNTNNDNNNTSNNVIPDYHQQNFSNFQDTGFNSSVEESTNLTNTSVVINSIALHSHNSTNEDGSTKKQISEESAGASHVTTQEYPRPSSEIPLPHGGAVSLSVSYGNPEPIVRSTFDSQSPSIATTAFMTTTSATTTSRQSTKIIATLEHSTKGNTSLVTQSESSEVVFNADYKRNEPVTALLANETVERLDKSDSQLEHKNVNKKDGTGLQENDYSNVRNGYMKSSSVEQKTLGEDHGRRSETTKKRRVAKGRKNARGHHFNPVQVETTKAFPTRRHHHRYNHIQEISSESSSGESPLGNRRDKNFSRNGERQRRPGRRERTSTTDGSSFENEVRKQMERIILEYTRHGRDNSVVLDGAENNGAEDAFKNISSPLVQPPIRSRDPKRQRSSFPSYVHKRSPSGSFGNNEIKSQPSSKSFTFSDCGKDPDRPIKFLKFRLDPAPIQLSTWGGKVKLSAKVNITRSLPDLVTANVTIIKFVVGMPIPVPCFNHMGTCHYKNLCRQLDDLWDSLQTRYQRKAHDQRDSLESRDNDVERDSIPRHTSPLPPPPWRKPSAHLISANHSACPRLLRSQYVPCKCPFHPSLYTLKKYIVPIPSLGFSSIFVEGEYEIKLEVFDGHDKSQLGCLKASFEMRRRERKVYII